MSNVVFKFPVDEKERIPHFEVPERKVKEHTYAHDDELLRDLDSSGREVIDGVSINDKIDGVTGKYTI